MAAEKLSNDVPGGLVGGNLSGWQVPHLGNIVPEVGTLEDPDEGRLVHVQARK